ncbi:MAG: PfkB family carbohydrate kinase [Anaerolineae bacterium]
MTSIVALGAVTVGIDLRSSHMELRELGLTPGSDSIIPVERMEEIRLTLENNRGNLPAPSSGGSVANTADLLARAGISCGFMGVGGNDTFGRIFVANCEKASLEFLSKLEDGAVTGYDFYLYDDDGVRTIILTHGANALLSPTRINVEAIQRSELVLLDCIALSFGPESETAMLRCVEAAEAADVPFVLALAGIEIVAGYRDFFNTFAPKSQMVAGNLDQAAVLVGLEPGTSLEAVRIKLAKMPIDAIVTLDADGAYARFGDDEFLVPTQKIEVVDSTGAGDNFLAAFLLARRQGLTVRQALAVGNIVASKVIQVHGVRLPISLDVPGLMLEAMQKAKSLDD